MSAIFAMSQVPDVWRITGVCDGCGAIEMFVASYSDAVAGLRRIAHPEIARGLRVIQRDPDPVKVRTVARHCMLLRLIREGWEIESADDSARALCRVCSKQSSDTEK